MDTRDVNPWEEHENGERPRGRGVRKGRPARRAPKSAAERERTHQRNAGRPSARSSSARSTSFGSTSAGRAAPGRRPSKDEAKRDRTKQASARARGESIRTRGASARTRGASRTHGPSTRTHEAPARTRAQQAPATQTSNASATSANTSNLRTARGLRKARAEAAASARSATQRTRHTPRPESGAPKSTRAPKRASAPRPSSAAPKSSSSSQLSRSFSPARLRTIVIVVLLVLIAGAVGAYFLFAYKGSQAAAPQTDSATAAFEPVACDASNAVIDLSVDQASLGAPVTFTMRMRNTDATHPCSLDVGSEKLDLTISSGDAELYSSAQCKPTPTSKLLLIPAASEATTTLTWNAASQCDQVGTAKAGTYSAEVTSTQEANLKDSLSFTLGK